MHVTRTGEKVVLTEIRQKRLEESDQSVENIMRDLKLYDERM